MNWPLAELRELTARWCGMVSYDSLDRERRGQVDQALEMILSSVAYEAAALVLHEPERHFCPRPLVAADEATSVVVPKGTPDTGTTKSGTTPHEPAPSPDI